MPYSKALEKRAAKKAPWPDLRYNIVTGEAKLFFKPEDVPKGWVAKPKNKFKPEPMKTYDKEKLIQELISFGVIVDPKWGSAHLNKVLNDISQSATKVAAQ